MTEIYKLIFCITFPPLFSFLLVFTILHLQNNLDTHIKKSKSIISQLASVIALRPEFGLSTQPALWLAILIPISYFLCLGGFIWAGRTPEISSDGIRNFLNISALPLGILSLAIPLAGLVARLHSTQQSATQINTAKLKNNIELYAAHRKSLFEYFDRIGERSLFGHLKISYKSHPKLHERAFVGDQEEGIPYPNYGFFRHVEEALHRASKSIIAISLDHSGEEAKDQYYTACRSVLTACELLGIMDLYTNIEKDSFQVTKKQPHEKLVQISFGQNSEQLIGSYRYCYDFFENLCLFSGYKSTFITYVTNGDTDVKTLHYGTDFFAAWGDFVGELKSQLQADQELLVTSLTRVPRIEQALIQ